MFVEKYPEKKAYFVSSNDSQAFALRTWLRTPSIILEAHAGDDKVSIDFKSDEEAGGLQGSER